MNHSLRTVLEVHHCSLFEIKLTKPSLVILVEYCVTSAADAYLHPSPGDSCRDQLRDAVNSGHMEHGIGFASPMFWRSFQVHTSQCPHSALTHWFMCSPQCYHFGFCVLWSCARSALTLVSVVVFRHGQKWASFTTAIC